MNETIILWAVPAVLMIVLITLLLVAIDQRKMIKEFKSIT